LEWLAEGLKKLRALPEEVYKKRIESWKAQLSNEIEAVLQHKNVI